RIRQILSNLLGNAVKFTSEGRIGLRVFAEPSEAKTRLLFEVSDTGIGFDQQTKSRLFQRFQQADGSITRRFGGSGLGLAISRALAQAMGGELDARAEPGRGATFTLTLELASSGAAAAPGRAPTSPAPPRGFENYRVLLADDHPINRRVVQLVLEA